MISYKNKVMQVISELGEKSCLTNILNAYNMGPITYDILTPAQDKTKVYVNSYNFKHENQKADSLFLENSLINLLDFINDKIATGELKYIPFTTPNRRNSSDYDAELILSEIVQKKYENLSQGWIISK